MAYTDSDKVKNFLQRDLTTYENSMLKTVIDAVKRFVDKRLDSTFDKATSTTRYFQGGTHSIDLDPCTEITAVKSVDDSGNTSNIYTENSDYVALPVNETVKNELVKRYGNFPRGLRRIAVTAKFSEYDDGVPEDIQIAATRLVAGVLNAGKIANQAGVQSESLEGHSVSYATGQSSLEGLCESDPIVSSIFELRKELYIDDEDDYAD